MENKTTGTEKRFELDGTYHENESLQTNYKPF